ncbi:cytochrome c-type biogenesis protein CcmH [Achromobacter sp. AGC78]
MSGRWFPLTLRQALMPALKVAILLTLSTAIAQTASPSPALAAPTAPALPALSPTDQQRADKLAHGLRCLVCQNQTLADSNAPLAQDMRKLIHAQLAEGRSDTQIMRFFEDRYGDFVRYDPPFKPITWLLWLGPFTLLALGFWVLVRTLKRRAVARAPLTADERARATRFLDTDP